MWLSQWPQRLPFTDISMTHFVTWPKQIVFELCQLTTRGTITRRHWPELTQKIKSKLNLQFWFCRWLSLVGKKLNVVNLPSIPSWYCKHPSGGLNYNPFADCSNNRMCFFDIRESGTAIDLADFNFPSPHRRSARESEIQTGRVSAGSPHVDVHCEIQYHLICTSVLKKYKFTMLSGIRSTNCRYLSIRGCLRIGKVPLNNLNLVNHVVITHTQQPR